MIAGSSPQAPAGISRARPGLSAQSLGLALMWLTLATSAVVFAEPAPYDILMIAMIAMLPLLRLTSLSTGVFIFLSAWQNIEIAHGACENRKQRREHKTRYNDTRVPLRSFSHKGCDQHGGEREINRDRYVFDRDIQYARERGGHQT